jgi:hypothetical protein
MVTGSVAFMAMLPVMIIRPRPAARFCMRKEGATFEEIALQLGTSVYQVANVYAQFTAELRQRPLARIAT